MIANAIQRKITIPGPRVSPLFGHITQVLNFVSDSIKLSSRLFEKYGSVVALASGLERVIKESMRVLSPIPWNGRVISQNTTLSGYDLPQGTEVFVSIYHTNRVPEIYSEPERFIPGRWEQIQPSIYEYNPFGAGSRACIGADFAMMEIKIILATLLMRYRLELLPQQVNAKGLIVLCAENGLSMRVYEQDREFNLGIGGISGNVREMVNLVE